MTLVVNQTESDAVRAIYARYLELGSVRRLKEDLDRRGVVSKVRISKVGRRSGGARFSRGALYELLSNPIYIGEIRHRKERHPGQHQAIVERELWNKAQLLLSQRAAHPRGQTTNAVANPLAGRLFDEAGEPLYVCRAAKGQRRYRYYVSRNLVRNPAGEAEGGWRLAAPEIERAVRSAAAQLLKDHSAIGALLNDAGLSVDELVRALKSIDQHRAGLEREHQSTAALARAINRIDLRKDGLQIALDLVPLLTDKHSDQIGTHLTITRFVPMQLKRRGVELRIVMAGESASNRAMDATLLKAIARGYRWFGELASGRARDTLQIAKRQGMGDRYVRRLIPLAFIAPSIIEAICTGRQPANLNAEWLTRAKLPLEWVDQQKALGISFGGSRN